MGFVMAAALDFLIGISISVFVVNNASALQRLIPANGRGAINSTRGFFSGLFSVAGTAVSGALLSLVDVRGLLVAGAIGLLLIAVSYLGMMRKSEAVGAKLVDVGNMKEDE